MPLPGLNPVDTAPPAGSTEEVATASMIARAWNKLTQLEQRIAGTERNAPPIITPWYRVGGPAGIANFSSSWTHYDLTAWGPVEVRKVGDEVQMRGSMKNGTINAGAISFQIASWHPLRSFAWPAGYQAAAADIAAYLFVQTDGVFTYTTPGTYNSFIPLDHVRWSTLPSTTS